MKKTKRILSLVAVSLVAVFALSCFLFAACGKDDDGGSDTHEHSWDEGVVTLEPTCAEEGEMTYTCECGETKTEPIPATGDHQFGEWEIKSAADCGNDEVDERVCSVCGKTEEQTVTGTATGQHTYDKAVFTWTSDDEGGYAATASLTCSVCGAVDETNKDVEATVTVKETTDESITYEATAVFGGTTYTEEKTVPLETEEGEGDETVTVPSEYENKNVYSLGVDFGEENTYGWIGTPTTSGTENGQSYTYLSVSTGDYTTGLLTYHVAASDVTVGKELAGALYTKDNNGDYFAIDLTGLAGDYVTLEVKMARNKETADTGTLTLATALSGGTTLKSVSSSSKTDKHTLAYGGVIGEEETLYLTWDKNLQIYSIDINVYGDVEVSEPEKTTKIELDKTELKLTLSNGTASGEVTATITGADGNPYTGETPTATCDDTTNAISVSIAAAGENGTYTVTVTATGEAENVTITVTAGEAEATFTVSVREASVTMAVNKTAMSFAGISQTDTSIVSVTDEWGETYSGGEYEVKIDCTDGGIATATLENGKLSVTSVASGSQTITLSLMKGNDVVETATISVTVAISGIEDGFTATYIADASQQKFVAATDSGDENGGTAVTFSDTTNANDFKTDEGKKYVYDENVSYDNYTNVNNSGKVVKITVAKGVTANITVYASHTSSNVSRTLNIKDSNGDVLAAETIDGYSTDRTYLWAVTATDLSAGEYTICATENYTIHVYAVVVKYEYASAAALETKQIDVDLSQWTFGTGVADQGLDDDGILFYIDTSGESCYNSTGGYVYTGEEDADGNGQTRATGTSQTLTDYFVIDLSNIEAETLCIKIKFSAQVTGDSGFMALVNAVESLTKGASVDSVSAGNVLASQNVSGTTHSTFEATVNVSEYDYLYIEFSVAIRLYSISLTINPQAE